MPIERRSPQPRGSFAVVHGAAPIFGPSPAAWDEIERPFGRQFNDDERRGVCAIVNRFLDHRRFEPAAPIVADELAEIDKVKQAARKLNGALNRLDAGPDRANEGARLAASLAIEREWPGGRGQRENNLFAVTMMSHALVAACIKAEKEEQAHRGIKIGDAWDGMVVELMEFAADCKFKVSVNKGQRSEVDLNPSPFVKFVKAIERHYPEGVAIRSYTDHGLSSAINSVRRARKKRGN